ncbi:Tubulin polyglutamylase TTLL7 [Larimichthys crocea]|uniref:Uncharacterized protein n=1 Tax=Larimichthys crocea TaxID=215358 RepID=A0ACD3RP35_LARCR|nr:Tubulin polyglutamylase TTLL7 [Larimichthys crocea]
MPVWLVGRDQKLVASVPVDKSVKPDKHCTRKTVVWCPLWVSQGHKLKNVMDCHSIKENKTCCNPSDNMLMHCTAPFLTSLPYHRQGSNGLHWFLQGTKRQRAPNYFAHQVELITDAKRLKPGTAPVLHLNLQLRSNHHHLQANKDYSSNRSALFASISNQAVSVTTVFLTAAVYYEEDILDLLEQCELDDEKLMGKSSRQRGPKPLTAMPECSQTPRRQRPDYLADFTSGSSADNSCSSSDDEEEDRRKAGGGGRGIEKREKKVSYDLGDSKDKNMAERSGRIHWKPPVKSSKTGSTSSASPTLSGPIRRSISCPRSIASLSSPSEVRVVSTRPSPTVPMATPLVRPSSATLRSHSLSRSGSAHRVPHSNSLGTIHSHIGDPLINLRSKEQEAELVRQTLAALTAMRIRFPGKTEEEAESVLDEILDNWKYHKSKVASYWLVKLDSTKQRKVLDIVRTNVRSALQRIWREPDVESLHLYRLFNRVFNRLLWSHGQGLWHCFSNTGSSWETIFSKSSEVVSPQELQCCRRLVQLCRDCLLVVYKFVSESRGSLTGLSPEWDDTRYWNAVSRSCLTALSRWKVS